LIQSSSMTNASPSPFRSGTTTVTSNLTPNKLSPPLPPPHPRHLRTPGCCR
jgi:hypothetical protein